MQIKSRLDLVQGYTCLKHVQHPFLLISITLFLVFLHLSFSSSLLLSSPSRNYYLAFNPAPQKSQQSGFIVYTTHPTHLPYSFLSSLKSKPHHFTPIFHLLCSSNRLKCAILPNQRTGEKKKKNSIILTSKIYTLWAGEAAQYNSCCQVWQPESDPDPHKSERTTHTQ